jgi:site-specific DNA-methyltransferase (adenine-specific)
MTSLVAEEKLPPYLYYGDCLEGIPVQAGRFGPFDLIYVDPPYNAGGLRGARLGEGSRSEGAVAYKDAWGGLDGFLSMMEPRLRCMHDALSDRGTLWVHLDYRATHDVKILCDGIFGRAGFAGEVIWVPGNGGKRRGGLSVTHQTILIYSKTPQFIYNAGDPLLREPFAETSLKMHFSNVDSEGRRYRERTINQKTYRYYADQGRRIGSVWTDCPAMRANTPLNKEATGYPTQKPESLLQRIIAASTVESSAVLDPMCGSGTTLAVAKKLGRRFAGCDQSPLSIATTTRRLEGPSKTRLDGASVRGIRSSRADS